MECMYIVCDDILLTKKESDISQGQIFKSICFRNKANTF